MLISILGIQGGRYEFVSGRQSLTDSDVCELTRRDHRVQFRVPLLGAFQHVNACTAATVALRLRELTNPFPQASVLTTEVLLLPIITVIFLRLVVCVCTLYLCMMIIFANSPLSDGECKYYGPQQKPRGMCEYVSVMHL